MKQKKERVLLVEPVRALALRAAQRIVAGGSEAVIVTSAAQARSAVGTFDRGMFAFDLPDGNGIVLAAEMTLETRIRGIGFFHPEEERVAREAHSGDLRTTAGECDQDERARSVA